jgi:hypothetical protein
MAASWPENPSLRRFTYERGEGRSKHRWIHDWAGFLPRKRGPIGKCHSSITEAIAQELLRSGFPATSPYDDSSSDPIEIYNIYRGVPYVAVITQPGKSYHGYPWSGRMPASIRQQLRLRAVEDGTVKVFDRWLQQHSRDR